MLTRLLGVAFYLALAFFILAFIFSNRAPVALDLFPLPAQAHMPLYIALCAVFLAGLAIGLLYAATLWMGMNRRLAHYQRRVAQLEKQNTP